MSLGPTYIRASDNHYYKEPVYRGEDWFLCFDEDDDPELVIKKSCRKQPQTILRQMGVKFRDIRKNGESMRVFGDNWEFEDARSYWVDIDEPPAPPNEFDAKYGSRDSIPGEYTLYAFGKTRP